MQEITTIICLWLEPFSSILNIFWMCWWYWLHVQHHMHCEMLHTSLLKRGAAQELLQRQHWPLADSCTLHVQLSLDPGLLYKKTLCSPLNGIRHGLAEGPPWSLEWRGQTLARKHVRVVNRHIPGFFFWQKCVFSHIILPIVWCFGVFLAFAFLLID